MAVWPSGCSAKIIEPFYKYYKILKYYNINNINIRRSWYKYSPEMLCAGLSKVDWSNTATDVQGVWNDFENKLIMVVDDLIPLSDFKNNIQVKLPSQLIKKKLSLRKRL